MTEEQFDSLSLAFLVLLESRSPEQRAVLLLHDVFDYGYGEIAPISAGGTTHFHNETFVALVLGTE